MFKVCQFSTEIPVPLEDIECPVPYIVNIEPSPPNTPKPVVASAPVNV